MTRMTPAALAAIKKVATALVQERAARERALQDVEERVRKQSAAVDEAIYEAVQAGATKAAIAKDGLGTSNRATIDERLRRHVYVTAGQFGTKIVGDLPAPDPVVHGITVGRGDDGATVVEMTGYTHPDVGEKVHATFRFDADGEFLPEHSGSVAVEMVTADPMLPFRVYALREVQDVVNA